MPDRSKTDEPRIDILVTKAGTFLTSPMLPDGRFPVSAEGEDDEGLLGSIRKFKNEIHARRLASARASARYFQSRAHNRSIR